MKRMTWFLALLLITASICQAATGTVIRPVDGTASDYFGTAVSATRTAGLVGSPYNEDGGSAYLYDFANGPITKLEADGADEVFGATVALNDQWAVVGAPFADTYDVDTGAVYLYSRAVFNLSLTQKLTAGQSQSNYGEAIGFDGQRLIVGARTELAGGIRSGAAYIYIQNGSGTWVQEARLALPAGANWDNFGKAVAIKGNVAMVGANPGGDGAVYYFVKNVAGWQLKQVLSTSGATSTFGDSLSLVDGHVLVGEPGYDEFSGSAHLFSSYEGEWAHAHQFLPASPADYALFGDSVSMIKGAFGNNLVVAIGEPNGNNFDGRAHIFSNQNGWHLRENLNPQVSLSSFGVSVSLAPKGIQGNQPDIILVGAPNDSVQASQSGAAYRFQ